MENKINIAELLKDCPQGMELDCTLIEGLEFDCIVDNKYLPIRCRIKNPNGGYNVYNFTKYGCWFDTTFAKCVIFPKGKTTWEGFVTPWQFKDGDVLTVENESNPFIFYCDCDGFYNVHCALLDDDFISFTTPNKWTSNHRKHRFATEAEKEKLFDAIKANGYKWNPETKTLEKLIVPKFKVGDRIRHKEKTKWVCTIARVKDRYYVDGHPMCFSLPFGKQDDYELVPNKFDITTLKPFESRVLVRDYDYQYWRVSFFGYFDKFMGKFDTVRGVYIQCIPYEGNEHLLGTTDYCDDFYKIWK